MSLPRALTRRALFWIAPLLLTIAPALAGPQTAAHTVNLTAPWKQGQTYATSVTASESNRMVLRQGDKVLQDKTDKRTARLEADAEAISSFPHGGLRKAAFTVRSLRVSLNGAPETDFLPAGSKIVAESTGADKKIFTIDGNPATKDQESVLKLVTSTDDPEHNDQMLFGPRKAVAIGESWEPDLAAIKATMGKDFGVEALVKGSMKLDGVEGSGPTQINLVSGSVTFDRFTPPLPPGVDAKSGVFHVKLDGRIPATRTATQRVENLTATADFVGEIKTPDGTVLTMMMTVVAKNASVLTFP
ncbi:MAG: hypothetical protein K0R17_3405 [Rariglobus sp.]|jgi:hypothetical protein|nr:hypothetical protein [Rariglobus sp.]